MKKITYTIIILALALVSIVPGAGAAPLFEGVPIDYGDVTWDDGLGLEGSSVVDECNIEIVGENEILHCVFDVTVTRTSNFWGATLVNVYVEMFNIVDYQPAYMYKDNDDYDNELAAIWIGLYSDCNNTKETSETQYCLWNATSSEEYFITSIYVPLLSNPDVDEEFNLTVEVYYSHGPISTCDASFVVLVEDSFEIDPTIEFPEGTVGDPSPVDEQIYPTVYGEYYKLYMTGGPWNDGATEQDRDSFQYSWDGETWEHFSASTCVEQAESGDLVMVYIFDAQSTTFHIRVWDDPGEYADNYDDPDPVVYHIALGVYEASTCEDQYTYDEFEDVVGYTGVDATDEDGVLANNAEIPLVVGQWYVLRWELNSWQDEGSPPDRIDLEYFQYYPNGWHDLAPGSPIVWCISSNGEEVLFQAHEENLMIRVNNEAGTFANNTGTPYYTLYQVNFTRTPESCEQQYQIGTLIEHRVVEADKSGGEVFASIVGGSIFHLDAALTPGAWYVVDTTDGPWWSLAVNPNYRYDMAVSEDNGDTWGQLEDWETPACNVALDTLGHRRVIFQMPSAGEEFWKLRVDAISGWFANQGEMEWDLYGAVKLENTLPDGSCDYSYDIENPVDLGEVDADDEIGVTLDGMNPGQIYAIKIVGNGYGWQEQFLGETIYDMQISHNDGIQWYSLPYDYPPSLCHEADGDDLIVFVQPGDNFVYKLRVDSASFSNNTGDMGYAVYPAEPGQSIINTCLDGWSLQVLNGFDWIDVRDEGGEVLSADTARYEEFIALVPGRSYMVETPAGQGPWGSFDELSTERWDTALSPDNGVNWEEISRDSVFVDCTDYDPVGHVWKAKFTVSEGEVWKIRVNDEAGSFANNTGNMAYKFYVLCEGMACTGSVPDDSDNIPAVSIQGGGDVCQLALIRPSSVLDVGAWIQYLNLSVLRYMAWCPRHTNMLQNFMNRFREREPFATWQEIEQVGQEVQQEIDAYDWGENAGSGESIYEMTDDGEFRTKVIDRIFGGSEERSIWEGGDVVDFDETGLPASYYSCESAFVNAIPSGLRPGVCFASAYMIETSASFWFQLSIDIAAFFMAVMITKNAAVDAVYLLTGVQLSTRATRSEARRGINEAGEWSRTAREHQDERARDDNAELLARALGGEFTRNDDGSYSRRR